MLDKLFELNKRGTNVRREIVAGVVTFLTMSYIVVVNPDILAQTGMDKNALIGVTILAAAFGTILVGFWANVPFAMAPGMGLNAMFTYMLVQGHGVTWQTALGVVFLSGLVFLLLTVIGAREKIVAAIPLSLRLGAGAGIGLFITFIGFNKLGLVVDNPATLVSLVSAFDGKIVFHSSANSRDKFSCNNCTNLFLDPVKHCKSGLTDLVCVSNPKVTEYLRKEFLRE